MVLMFFFFLEVLKHVSLNEIFSESQFHKIDQYDILLM